MAISNAAQFALLLWKNWLLQKRRILVTTFQILIPAVLALILLSIRTIVDSTFVSSPTIIDSFEASPSFPPNLTLPQKLTQSSPLNKWRLVYSPNTSNAAIRMTLNITQMLDVVSKGKILCLLLTLSTVVFCSVAVDYFWLVQVAQLSQRDRVTHELLRFTKLRSGIFEPPIGDIWKR